MLIERANQKQNSTTTTPKKTATNCVTQIVIFSLLYKEYIPKY